MDKDIKNVLKFKYRLITEESKAYKAFLRDV